MKNLVSKLPKLSLVSYVFVSIALIILCALFFPDRFPSLLGFVNRLFVATVFVNVVYWVQPGLDEEGKPFMIGAGLVAAGMAV